MIIRILQVQTEGDLRFWTFMKIMLRMELTTSTIFPIAMNLAIRTSYNIMIHISLNGHQNLLECLQHHSHTQILLKPLKVLHCFWLPFCHC